MSTISRREFVKLFAAVSGGIVVSSGLQGCFSNNDDNLNIQFSHGVASGDPLIDSVIIWTKVTVESGKDVSVQWEVASDSAFTKIVNRASSNVTASTDHTLKVDVKGLQPATTYYYRFSVNNQYSPTGMTKTLPMNPSQVKLAVFSCANYPSGFFHAYGAAANYASEIDAVLHLGDYIYEYDKNGYPDAGTGESINRVHLPVTECLTLADYRQRYAQYHTDSNLQKLHAAAPFICVWDDHEIANDAYKSGAQNHSETEGDYTLRKLAAIQAWYEWLPVRSPVIEQDRIKIYRRFDFGQILSLLMLDTRIIGRDKPLDYLDYMTSSGFNATQFATDLASPDRSLLGLEQRNWLQAQLQDSVGRGVTWQVLGQQVLMAKLWLPASILQLDPSTGYPNPQNLINYQVAATAYQQLATAVVTQLTISGTLSTYAAQIPGFASLSATNQAIALTEAVKVNDAVLYGQIFSSLAPQVQSDLMTYGSLLDPTLNPAIPYNLDAWDGYAVDRETLFATVRALNARLVVLAGDTHNAWANNLVDQSGNAVGVEFATASVSSPGLEKYLSIPVGAEASTETGIMQLVSAIKYFNVSQRGFMMVSFTADQVRADWYLMAREAEKQATAPDITAVKSIVVSAQDKSIA